VIADQAPDGAAAAAGAAGDAAPVRTRHVLVADDEPHIGRIIQMKLEQGPFRVTLVADGREALDALEHGPPVDLVLLDLMMPHVSGLDVLRRVRGDARFRGLPCMILTAAGQEQQYRQAMALGATDFMTKPFSPKKLYARAAELAGVAGPDAAAGAA
jgi:CheY-like chemotaxis protein